MFINIIVLIMLHITKSLSYRTVGSLLGTSLISHNIYSSKVQCKPLSASASTISTPVTSSLTSGSRTNPLLMKDYTPLFTDIQTDDILPAITNDLTKLKEDFNAIESILRNPKNGEAWGKFLLYYHL